MSKKEMIAMLLAGGQGSRLGVLTRKIAKPAVAFGGKYRIIDFSLSNCINSGIDTVGVLTQYQPLRLNTHIGIGIPWDLDRNFGGVTILSPHETKEGSDWYSGTANAIYRNLDYIDSYDPDYILVLSGDHIYKMDYGEMLEYHKKKNAVLTVACRSVPWEEASRFGLAVTDETGMITKFEEKPEKPSSNLASMGIYIFDFKKLRDVLIQLKDTPNLDFGKHVIPTLRDKKERIYAYQFEGYWKDVGTLQSYWEANMGLVDIIPEFNLYEEYWRIMTKCENIRPQYLGETASTFKCIISDGCWINGSIDNSVLGSGVVLSEGSSIKDSIIMDNVVIGKNTIIDKAIIAENTVIGENCIIGEGNYAQSEYDAKVYQSDLAVIAENSVIPSGVIVGRNTAIEGTTTMQDYPQGRLKSGGAIVKEDDL